MHLRKGARAATKLRSRLFHLRFRCAVICKPTRRISQSRFIFQVWITTACQRKSGIAHVLQVADQVPIEAVIHRVPRARKEVAAEAVAVVRVDAENNLLLVRGAVPGPNGGFVTVRQTNKVG